jgi:hypothetical protein
MGQIGLSTFSVLDNYCTEREIIIYKIDFNFKDRRLAWPNILRFVHVPFRGNLGRHSVYTCCL